MAFWSNAGPEPKRQYRWYIQFGSQTAGLDNLRYALKKVDKPKAKVNTVQHKYLNHFFNYPGRLEWEDISLTFASITDPDATKVLNDVLLNSGYQIPTQGNIAEPPLKTISKTGAVKAIGNSVKIAQINPSGAEIEVWELYNPFFINVQFGGLDYSSEEIVEIQCTMKYDWATLGTSDIANDLSGPQGTNI
jgi:hypothetical protein